MANYVHISMPKSDAERLLEIITQATAPSYGFDRHERDDRIVRRLRATLKDRDLRTTNEHNTHKVKRPRVYLDLRRKSA